MEHWEFMEFSMSFSCYCKFYRKRHWLPLFRTIFKIFVMNTLGRYSVYLLSKEWVFFDFFCFFFFTKQHYKSNVSFPYNSICAAEASTPSLLIRLRSGRLLLPSIKYLGFLNSVFLSSNTTHCMWPHHLACFSLTFGNCGWRHWCKYWYSGCAVTVSNKLPLISDPEVLYLLLAPMRLWLAN